MDSLETKILNREAVIVRLAEMNLQEEPIERTELETLKQTFYKLRIAEVEAAKKEGMGPYNAEDVFFVVQGEMEYGDSLEE